MKDSEYYVQKANLFARLAVEARSTPEREGFTGVAAGYLELAKTAAKRKVRVAVRQPLKA
jgi:hypothetical protein